MRDRHRAERHWSGSCWPRPPVGIDDGRRAGSPAQIETARVARGFHLIVPAVRFARDACRRRVSQDGLGRVSIGFAVGSDGEEMPYSTSVPMIRCILTTLTGALAATDERLDPARTRLGGISGGFAVSGAGRDAISNWRIPWLSATDSADVFGKRYGEVLLVVLQRIGARSRGCTTPTRSTTAPPNCGTSWMPARSRRRTAPSAPPQRPALLVDERHREGVDRPGKPRRSAAST